MAAAAEMDIIIGAEVQGAVNGLKTVNAQLIKTEQTATKVTQKTSTNFTGLSRVIQDLPFGFIAISNNLTQLLPAAGALGLAFSAIVSAVTFASTGFRNWSRQTKESKDASDEFAKSLNSVKAGAIETGVKLQAFVNIAKDNTKSLGERNFALAEANKLMGEHGTKLTLVNVATAAVTEEVNKFTQALIAQAVAGKFADKIADLIIKQKDASLAYGEALKKYNAVAQETADINKNTFSGGAGGVGGLGNTAQTTKAVGAFNSLKNAASSYKDITQELHQTNSLFNESIGESVSLFGQLGIKADESKKKLKQVSDFFLVDTNIKDISKKFIDKIAVETGDHLGEVQKVLDKNPLQFNLKPAEPVDETLTKIAEATAFISGAFDQIFSSIGNGGNALQSITDGLKGLLIDLTKTLIKAAALSVILSALGFGTFSIGKIFGQLAGLGSLLKFASGGVVTKPTLALVGEQGPERITPLGYEAQAKRMMPTDFTFRISGSDLIAVSKRANNNAYYTF